MYFESPRVKSWLRDHLSWMGLFCGCDPFLPHCPWFSNLTIIQCYTVWAVSPNLRWCADMRCRVLWLQTHWTAMSLRSAATGRPILRTPTASRYTSQPTTTSTACLVCDARTLCGASLPSGPAAGLVRNCPYHFQHITSALRSNAADIAGFPAPQQTLQLPTLGLVSWGGCLALPIQVPPKRQKLQHLPKMLGNIQHSM